MKNNVTDYRENQTEEILVKPESPYDYPLILSKLPKHYDDVLKLISHPDVRKVWRDSLKVTIGRIEYCQRYIDYCDYELCMEERGKMTDLDVENVKQRQRERITELVKSQTQLEKTHNHIFEILKKQVIDIEHDFYKKEGVKFVESPDNTEKEEN